jgi:hypothetical protein
MRWKLPPPHRHRACVAPYNGRMNPNITTEPTDKTTAAHTPQPDEPDPDNPKLEAKDEVPPPTPLEVRETLKLGDTRPDRAIAKNVASGISIEQQVETRAKELLMKKKNGRRLTKGEQNLVDFYNVDVVHRHPSGAQQADMLRRAESVTEDLHWLR